MSAFIMSSILTTVRTHNNFLHFTISRPHSHYTPSRAELSWA